MAAGAAGNLLGAGNRGLINKVSDEYAEYKLGTITREQYNYRRKAALDELKRNIGPFEKHLFGKQTTHESIRIARGGGIPATANIARHADRLKNLARVSKGAGYVLVGVGMTAACLQIANTTDRKEKTKYLLRRLPVQQWVLSAVLLSLHILSPVRLAGDRRLCWLSAVLGEVMC